MNLTLVRQRQRILVWLGCFLLSVVATGWHSAVAADAPPTGLRVFYTGHSFHMFVPGRISQIAKLAGIEGHKEVGTQGIGGSKVIQHWDRPDEMNTAKKALATGDVDVFTMAAHLAIPDPGITNFTEFGLMHNPKLRLLVQASWYPWDVPPTSKKHIFDNIKRNELTVDELQAAIDEWRKKLEAQADELNQKHQRQAVLIVPVGDAVVKLRGLVIDGKFPGVKTQAELFTDPIGHAGPVVQSLAAYCNFVAIYRISPEGLKVTANSPEAEQHAILQRIAWETVSKYPYAGVSPRP